MHGNPGRSVHLVVRRLPRLELGRGEVLVAADQGAEAGRGKILKGERKMLLMFN